MEICDECHTKFFRGECDCPTILTLERLKEIVGSDTMRITYGNPKGRTETYYIDDEDMSGYDSYGNYRILPIEELDLEYVQEINKLTTVFKRN